MQTAASLGANAVLGVDIDYEVISARAVAPGIEHRNRGHRRVTSTAQAHPGKSARSAT